MNILMPLADGEYIDRRTLSSIVDQISVCKLVPITRPKNKRSRRISEAECRNELIKYASYPYTFYLDSDAYFTSPNDVSDCIKFLDNNQHFDAVALDTKCLGSIKKQEKRFVVIAAMCVRTSILKSITFRPTIENNKERCLCVAFNKDTKIIYLDNRRLGEINR